MSEGLPAAGDYSTRGCPRKSWIVELGREGSGSCIQEGMEKMDHDDVVGVVVPRVVNPREPVTCRRTAALGLGRAQGTRMSRVPVSTFPGKAMVELTSSSLLRLRPFQHCSGVGGLGNFAQLGIIEIWGNQLSAACTVGPIKSPQLATEIASRRRIRIIFPSSFNFMLDRCFLRVRESRRLCWHRPD